MEEKIKNALKLAGLDEGLWDKIKADTEDKIMPAVIAYVKQSTGDRLVTEKMQEYTGKIKTLEEKNTELEAKITAAGTPPNAVVTPGVPAEGAKPGTPDIAKIVLDAITAATKPMQDEIAAMKGATAADKRSIMVAEHLKTAGLSETLVNFINGDTEDEIKANVETLKTQTITAKQAEFDAQLAAAGVPPIRGSLGEKVNTDTVNAIVAKHPNRKDQPKE